MNWRRLASLVRDSAPPFWPALAVAMALTFPSPVHARPCSIGWPLDWRLRMNAAESPDVIFAFPTTLPHLPAEPAPGLFIALDPETGLPTRPSAAQRRAAAAILEEAEALAAPLGPLPVARAPGGGEIVHLRGRFQVYSIARRAADGSFVTDCSLDPAAARRLLSQPAPIESKREEK